MPLPLTISEKKEQSKKCFTATNPQITTFNTTKEKGEGQFQLTGLQTKPRNSVRDYCAEKSQGEDLQRQYSPVQSAALQSPCR